MRGRWRTGAAGTAIGWAAALLLHGGLVLAVILAQPVRVPQIPGRAVISLVWEKPSPQPFSGPVAPKPGEVTAKRPKVAPTEIANARPSPPLLVPKPVAPAQKPAKAAQPVTPPQGMPSATAQPNPAPGPTGFVAAEPLPGNVNQPPEYPQAALAYGEQGKVLLSIHVLPDGRTDFVSVTRSSGYRVLDQAAEDAVLQWRFRPATMAGQKVVMVIPFWINFDLQTQTAENQ